MRRVFTSQDLVEVEMLKEGLEHAGIPCTIKNQRTSGLAGMVPFAEVFPELWVLKDEDYDRAKDLLEVRANAADATQTAWTCAGCGESHSNEFMACWKCGWERDSKSEPQRAFRPESDRPSHKATSTLQILTAFALGAVMAVSGTTLWDYFSMNHVHTDRNGDGKDDMILSYVGGVLRSASYDDDFDGYFETRYEYNRKGFVIRGEIDRNHDGKPDLIEDYTLNKLSSQEFLDKETGRVVKRSFYKLGAKVREEIDRDGDGIFEQTIHFDEFEFAID
jgi:hypothetical protein